MRVVSNKKEAKQCLHAPFYASIFMDPCGGVQARRARAYAARPTCSSCCACACASCCCCAVAPCCAWALEIISWRRTVRRAVRRATPRPPIIAAGGARTELRAGRRTSGAADQKAAAQVPATTESAGSCGARQRAGRRRARAPQPVARHARRCAGPARRERARFFVTLRLGIRELRRSTPAAPCKQTNKQTNKQTIFCVAYRMHACMHACMLFSRAVGAGSLTSTFRMARINTHVQSTMVRSLTL